MNFPIRHLDDQENRNAFLQRGISQVHYGVEIGPYFAPVFPKSQGWNVISTDAFSTAELIERCASNEAISGAVHNIEEVDIVSSESIYDALSRHQGASAQLDSGFDYICSSHSFEHLPNPIGFLQDVEKILSDGGLLVMAIPVHSECFDLLRPRSTLGEMIDAYLGGRRRPSPGQYTDHVLSYANFLRKDHLVAPSKLSGSKVVTSLPNSDRKHCYNKEWFNLVVQKHINGEYLDAHCWCFSAASFILLFADMKALGLISDLKLVEIVIYGSEFLVRICKMPQHQIDTQSEEGFSRIDLLSEVQRQDLRSLRHILMP